MQTRGRIAISMYGCDLTIIITDKSVLKIYKNLQKKHNETHPMTHEPAGIAFSPDDDHSQYYIIFNCANDCIDIEVFTHEIDHIKNYILFHRDVHYNRSKDEVGAYLSGHIASAVYKLMKKKGIEFNVNGK